MVREGERERILPTSFERVERDRRLRHFRFERERVARRGVRVERWGVKGMEREVVEERRE